MSVRPKGAFLYYCDIENPELELSGVDRKVLAQIKAFNDAGLDCGFIYVPRPTSFLRKAVSCLPFASDGVEWPDVKQLGPLDFLYIRRPVYASSDLLGFLRQFRAKNPDAKVLYEIPTYPYDAEMRGVNHLALVKDRHHRHKLREHVDYVLDLSGQKEIFGVPTIQMSNGVDLDRVAARNALENDGTMNLLFVAFFSEWHGVDRIIRGLGEYRKKGFDRKIKLHLAGEGQILGSIRKLVASLSLQENVVFHGHCDSGALEDLYSSCDIAVASLGLHRIGIDVSSTLKSREYLAKGIPFVYSGKIDVFLDEPVDFCLEVPADESPIDIESVLAFYDALSGASNKEELTDRIRRYAIRHVGMDSAMKNVIALLL